MKSGFKLMVAAVTLVSAVGCKVADPEMDLVGSYKGDVKLPKDQESGPAAEVAKAFMGNITLELNKDHTFKLNVVFSIEGTWAYKQTMVELTPTKMMGMTIEEAKKLAVESAKKAGQEAPDEDEMSKPMELLIENEGKLLRMKATKKDQGEMSFTKIEAAK